MTDLDFQKFPLILDVNSGTVPSQIVFTSLHCSLFTVCISCTNYINTKLTAMVIQICGAMEWAQVTLLGDKCWMAWATGADVTYFQCATCRLFVVKMCKDHFALGINPLKEKFSVTCLKVTFYISYILICCKWYNCCLLWKSYSSYTYPL